MCFFGGLHTHISVTDRLVHVTNRQSYFQQSIIYVYQNQKELYSILTPWFLQLRISFVFLFETFDFLLVKPIKENVTFLNCFKYIFK